MAQSTSSETWMRIWMQRGLRACLLFPLSLLFRFIVKVRRAAYAAGFARSSRLPVPLVIVGNIFIGGTGKTPFTIWLVNVLRKAGFTPGVISRGYGVTKNKSNTPRSVSQTSSPDEVGDEPLLIAINAQCPVTIGRNRTEAAQALLASHPEIDIVISDDGMQNYALERDIEIMLFDDRGAGNGWMLPAGPLREPLSRRRDFTIINGNMVPEAIRETSSDSLFFMRLAGHVAEQLKDRSRHLSLNALSEPVSDRQPRIVAAAGIGNPVRFFNMLRLAGVCFSEIPLPDHFAFATNPFANMEADIILITEKDAVKCVRIKEFAQDDRIWVVPVKAQMSGELEQRIVEKCREYRIA